MGVLLQKILGGGQNPSVGGGGHRGLGGALALPLYMLKEERGPGYKVRTTWLSHDNT